jgi:hypothetical protein
VKARTIKRTCIPHATPRVMCGDKMRRRARGHGDWNARGHGQGEASSHNHQGREGGSGRPPPATVDKNCVTLVFPTISSAHTRLDLAPRDVSDERKCAREGREREGGLTRHCQGAPLRHVGRVVAGRVQVVVCCTPFCTENDISLTADSEEAPIQRLRVWSPWPWRAMVCCDCQHHAAMIAVLPMSPRRWPSACSLAQGGWCA